MIGLLTLLHKELLRFCKVAVQTVAAPVLTSVLYLLVFAQALQAHVPVFQGVSYGQFLVPGLVMMAVLQNAFANTSSSLIQSKITGNLVFILLPPLGPSTLLAAYVLAAMVRGLCVGLGVGLVTLWWWTPAWESPIWSVVFALLGSAILGTIGLLGGLWAEKFDQIAMVQNFLIMPATFLAGVFYSVQSLPPFWQAVSHFNPFFYMVDGFRFGLIGHSDVPPMTSLWVTVLTLVGVLGVAMRALQTGWRIRH